MDCSKKENKLSRECNEKLSEIEDQNRQELLESPNKNDFLYPTLDDPNFNVKIANKKEFADTKYDGTIRNIEEYSDILSKADFELAPHQIFVKNFLSTYTPYNSLLLYHGLGSGKTCSAIGVAEEMRDYYTQLGIEKKIIIVASPNVQDNFKLQLFDERKLKQENGTWTITGCLSNKLIKEINPTRMRGLTKDKLIFMIKNIINHYYTFTGYIQFSNEIEIYKKEGKIRELQRKYNDSLIIIDEVHNISLSSDVSSKKKKKEKIRTGEGIGKNLLQLVTICQHVRLLLLSATPMFNDYRDIIWFLNLMNLNDSRSVIKLSDVFTAQGEFVPETGRDLFIKKSTGYISFVRGENPYIFPFRIYPINFDKNSSLDKDFIYPIYQLNCKRIKDEEKITKLDLYLTKIGRNQSFGYNFVISLLREKLKNRSNKKKSLGFLDLQIPLQCLNIVYPSTKLQDLPISQCDFNNTSDLVFDEDSVNNLSEEMETEMNLESEEKDQSPSSGTPLVEVIKTDTDSDTNFPALTSTIQSGGEDEEVIEEDDEFEESDYDKQFINPKELTGSDGLKKIMNYQDSIKPMIKGKFEYKKEVEEQYGRIFSYDKIGTYSSKIKQILDSVLNSKNGIILIYSAFIDGGLVPMALALEELGLNKFGGKNLFLNKPKDTKEMGSFSYVMITGDNRLSPNNNSEVKVLTGDDNKNGNKIKVVLISVAGSEGLDFKFIRQIHIMEPWYNLNRTEQIIGRGVRSMSHKDLPFKQRNVQIYQYATILENQEEESADFYVYRLAESKAIKIGKISRLLKENSVDCLINAEQMNFTTENFNDQPLTIELSNGVVINNYLAGDKPNSSTCDYMENCEYKCIAIKDVDINENENLESYNEEFMLINSEKIIVKIKKLFKKRYFYKKGELFQKINFPKSFPKEQIFAALTNLIDDKSESLLDKYGREGKLINIGEYYLFQPLELNNPNISIMERSIPLPIKLDSVRVDISQTKSKEEIVDQIDEKINDEITLIKKDNERGKNVYNNILNLYNLTKSTFTISRGETDWYKICGAVIVKMAKEGYPIKDLQDFLISHIVESLMIDEKIQLLNYLELTKNTCQESEENIFLNKIKKYFCNQFIYVNNILGIGVVNGPTKKNLIMFVNKNNQWIKAEPEDERELLSEFNKKYPQIDNFNQYVGFIGFEDKIKYMVFKVKDTFQSRNKGSRCDQAGKQKTLELLNKIVGKEEFTKENTRGQVLLELCIRQEFILRYFNSIKKDNLVWFVTTEESVFNSLTN